MSAISAGPDRAQREPVIRVVRGAPTPVELAALVAVLLARRGGGPVPLPPPAARWAASVRPGAVGPAGMPTRPGPDAWRASASPR